MHDRSVMNSHLASRSVQIRAIHIPPQSLLLNFGIISLRFLLVCVLASAKHATIPLTPGPYLSSFILMLRIETLWTLLHPFI